MHSLLGAGVDADVQMKQVGVDGWRQVSCLRVPEKYAVMGSAPDRHPATFTAQPPEIVLKPLTLLAPPVFTFENAVLLDERGAMRSGTGARRTARR